MDNGTPHKTETVMEDTKKDTKVLDPYDKYKHDWCYAVTITFKRLVLKTPFGQFKETAPYLTKLLQECADFELYPEWRHTTGDIHYHGCIFIWDFVKWFKRVLPSLKNQGFLLLKKIDKPDKWLTYCKKEVHIAKQIIPEQITLPIDKQIMVSKIKNKRILVMPSIETVIKEYSDSE
jgi:hypothetical protein